MTPKTQSVCKHCPQEADYWWHSRAAISDEMYHPFEPVDEPASTGEPRGITDTYEEGDENPSNVRFTYPAARPSEPSAPQASAEPTCGKPAASLIPRWGMSWACALPPNHEGECAPGGNCVKHGKYICKPNEQPKCPKWPDCISAAAPQPVSGDAPEVEEIARGLMTWLHHYDLSSLDSERLAEIESILIDWLRRYFPPASQTPTISEHVLDEIVLAVCEIPDRTSPDDFPEAMIVTPEELRFIIRDKFKQAAIPASTARTDGETK